MRTSQQSFLLYFKSLGLRSVEFPAATVKFSHTFTPMTFQHGGYTERPHDVTPSRMVSANGKQPLLGDQWEAVFVCANQWKTVYAGTGLAYSLHTIARWQKILHNNSKRAVKIFIDRSIFMAVRPPILAKSCRKRPTFFSSCFFLCK